MSEPLQYGPADSSASCDDPVSFEELAWLLADQLAPTQEAALRARMDKDPTVAAKLARIGAVDALFDPPAPMKVIGPMPPASVARLDGVLDALAAQEEPPRATLATEPPRGESPTVSNGGPDDGLDDEEHIDEAHEDGAHELGTSRRGRPSDRRC